MVAEIRSTRLRKCDLRMYNVMYIPFTRIEINVMQAFHPFERQDRKRKATEMILG